MRIKLILFTLFISTLGYSQIKEGVTYTEDEIAIQDKFVEAKKYALIGRFEKAEEILKKLYGDDRKNPAIAMELSKIYGYLEDPFNQSKYAKTAFENSPSNEYVLINYATICMDQEKFEEAIPVLQKLVIKNPASEAYSDKLATAFLQINDSDSALTTYSNLESKIGVNKNISRRKYEIYEVLGKKKKALGELKKLSEAFPNNISFMHNLASYYNKLGKEKEALNVYKRILEIDIDDATANMAVTVASTGDGDDNNYLRSLTPIIENKSIPVDRKILELVPYVDQLNTSDEAEFEALIMLSERITIIHPKEAKSFALYGDVLLAAKRPKDAAKSYEKTLTLNDKVYQVWEGLMEAYTDIKDYKSLLRVSTDALDYFPNKASAYMYYGRANTLNKIYDEAIDILNEGLFVSGKDIYNKSNIYAELGRAHAASNNMESAEKNIAKALELSSNKNGLALEINGDILYQKGDTAGAINEWKKAQEAGHKSILLTEKIESKKL